MPDDPEAKTFWLVGSVIESSLWTLACVVSTVAWTMIFKPIAMAPLPWLVCRLAQVTKLACVLLVSLRQPLE